MTDERALLAAIWDNPHDDLPRLVYADWLDETGEPAKVARAEFIRVQCELAKMDEDGPMWKELKARQDVLWDANKAYWKVGPVKRYWGRFERGFPILSLFELSMEQLLRAGSRRLCHSPLWRHHYGVSFQHFNPLLVWPYLHKLELFAMSMMRAETSLSKGWAKRMAECEGLRNVAELAFVQCPVTANDLGILLDAWRGRTLRELWLNDCRVGDDGLTLLAHHPAATGLRIFRAYSAGFTAVGAKALADSPYLNRLVEVTIATNHLGDDGIRHLLRWPRLTRIRRLAVHGNGVSPSVADELRSRVSCHVQV